MPMPQELRERIHLDGWDALAVAVAITVSPYASEEYEQRVKTAVAAISEGAFARMEQCPRPRGVPKNPH